MPKLGFRKTIHKGLDVSITTTDFGSFRPNDDPEFSSRFELLRNQLEIEGDVVAQQLGMNQEFTDLIKGLDGLTKWQDKSKPEDPEAKINNFLRTKEKTDGLILPGSRYWRITHPSLHNSIRKIRNQIEAVQIYNADCPVVVVSDTRDSINAVLHGALECLHSMPDQEGNGGGESLLINVVNYLSETYNICPNDLQVTVMGGAGPCCYGYTTGSTGKYLNHLQQLENYQATTKGKTPIVERGDQEPQNFWQRLKHRFYKPGIKKGPRQGGHSINIGELVLRQATKLGVKSKNITIDSYCTCCAGRSYHDIEQKQSSNESGHHFSNIYRSDTVDKEGKKIIDQRRNAFTVKLNQTWWQRKGKVIMDKFANRLRNQ